MWDETKPIVIPCARAITPYLQGEVAALGFPVVSVSESLVETAGTLTDTFLLNLSLRTGQRVLFFLREFTARDSDELYRALARLPWEEMVPKGGYVSVTSSVDNPTILDSRFANLRFKDAVVDRIRRKTGTRPDSGPLRAHTVLHLYWKEDLCRVYLDTSGEPLSRRGYRKIPLRAPMQETLAAAVVIAAGWDGKGAFVNPMCGSGTLAVEAALLALGRAPGLLRNNYGFMHLAGFDRGLYQAIRKRVRGASGKSLPGRIIASDRDPAAVEAARRNAATAGLTDMIEFHVCDFAETPVPEGDGVVVINPEYGERMGEVRKLAPVYARIGDFLKNRCQGYRGYVFTGNLSLAKKVGLRARRRIPFFNSRIECRLLEYELYPGSRRSS
jgi:putative N6-adenine-specific DNA methylase